MAIVRIRTSQQLIDAAAEGRRSLQPIKDFWEHLRHVKVHERIHEGLLQAGIPNGRADEGAEAMRHYIAEIDAALEKAIYLMNEAATEMIDLRTAATRAAGDSSSFQV
jgi:hypothetical protein